MDAQSSIPDVVRQIGLDAKPIFLTVTRWFQADGFGPFLAAALIGLGLLILGILVCRTAFVLHHIYSARTLLLSIADPASFVAQFPAVDEALRKNPPVAHAWTTFTSGLSYPGPGASTSPNEFAIRSPIRPQAALTTEEADLTLPYFKLWPNLFVGIGLLLTFAGLVSALELAVSGFSNGGANPAEMQKSLSGLLTTSAAKFYSSLAALAVSLALTISVRLCQTIIAGALHSLATAIEHLVRPVTAESILGAQLQELEEHSRQLKTFNTDLAMKIGERIEIAVSGALKGVGDKLDKVASSLGQDNVSAIREIGESVSRSMQGAAGASIERLANQMEGVSGALSSLVNSLGQSGRAFQSDMAGATAKLGEEMGALSASMSNITAGMKTTLQDGATNITQTLEAAIRALGTSTERNANSIEEAIKRLSNGIEDATSTATRQASDAIEHAGTAAAGKFSSTADKVSDALVAGFAPIQSTAGMLASSLEGTQTASDRLSASMKEATRGVSDASQQLERAAQHVSTTSQQLASAIEPALTASARIERAIEAVRETSAQVKTASEGIGADLAATRSLWERHAARFDGVDQKLGEAFRQITDNLSANVEKLAGFVRETDDQFAQAVAALTEAVHDMQDAQQTGESRQ